jgi:diacylglycerol kinase (ATP)
VWLDGECLYDGELLLAAVANGRYFGGGMCIAPEAKMDDGLLDLVIIPGVPLTELLRRMPKLYDGSILSVDKVLHARGRRIETRCEPGSVGLEIDGEPLGGPPSVHEVLPGAIRLVGVPAP